MAVNALIAQGIRPIGADLPEVGQMLNQKRQMDTRNALAMRDQQIQEQNANAYQESLGLQRQNQLAQREAANQTAMRERAGAILDNLQSVAGTPQYGEIVSQLQAAPQVAQSARALGLDVSRLSDPNYLPVARGIVGMEAAKIEKPYQITTQAGPNGSSIVTDGSRFQVVDKPQAAGGGATKWQKVDQTLPDGKVQSGFVDMSAPDPAATFRPIGAPSAAARDPKVTEGERAAAGYLLRMETAEQGVGQYMPSTKDFVLYGRALSSGDGLAALSNANISPEGQQYFQNATDWARAKLRSESGASISPMEIVQEVRNYFPVPGDSPQTIAQKETARRTANEAMRLKAGTAAKEAPAASRQVRRTGTLNGRKVIEYTDGSIEYGN